LSSWARLRFDPDHIWNEAQTAFLEGRFEDADATLAWIRRFRSPMDRDRTLEAQIAAALGQTERALAGLLGIPEGSRYAGQAYLFAGRLERQRHRVSAAESHLRRAIRVEPRLVEAHRELICIYGIQSRRREVDAEFRALARLVSVNYHDLYTWALTRFSRWNTDVARDLEKFIEADPNDRDSRLALAKILSLEAKNEVELESALAGLPESDPAALAARARYRLSHGEPGKVDAMLRLAPAGHAAIDQFRGQVAMQRRDFATAVKAYRSAMALEPTDRVLTFEFGRALASAGDTEAAKPHFDRARRLDAVYDLLMRLRPPNREGDPAEAIQMGKALEAAHLTDVARCWFELAVSQDPTNTEAQKGLHGLPRKGEQKNYEM
jgi:tetratricopeptide (TPR) repeat protein